jgi:uncharacterized protein (DUF2062 family)
MKQVNPAVFWCLLVGWAERRKLRHKPSDHALSAAVAAVVSAAVSATASAEGADKEQ